MKDRVVIVTGATKGLGKALSWTFASSGYAAIGLYGSDDSAARSLKTEFESKGHNGRFIKQDVTDENTWPEFEKIIETVVGNEITLIINAHASFIPTPFHLVKLSDLSRQIETGLNGAFLTIRRVLPYMVRYHAGTIVSILSTALSETPKGFSAYVAAKSALAGLTRSVASEYTERGIRVFSVSPGLMNTSMTDSWSSHLKAHIGSLRDPAEIAAGILALVDDPNTNGEGEDYKIT